MQVFSYIKCLTFNKILNCFRLKSCFSKLKTKIQDISDVTLPPPSFLSFEPTNYCNLKCPACPSGSGVLTRAKGFADIELFKKLIDENKKYLINILLHFQGEPLLHSQIGEMISYARKNRIFTELSTNANLFPDVFNSLKNSMPDKLIISLDGTTQDIYNKYRVNGDINKVYDALKLLSQSPKKKRPFVEVQFLVFSHNEDEIPKLKEIKSQYKIDKISLKTAQIYESSQIPMLPKNNKYSRYNLEGDSFSLKSKLKNKCRRIVFGSVITWDGKLVPCCFDKDAEFVMGNVNSHSVNEIRNSEKYREFIKRVFSQRKSIEMCRNCTEI
ncbi:MAG: radical SAM/SPASM domain-containing protein [Bacteroidales bacterium]|nr:radical SAM/SPASM domain-containing protein [Bacteroidales bacterium]